MAINVDAIVLESSVWGFFSFLSLVFCCFVFCFIGKRFLCVILAVLELKAGLEHRDHTCLYLSSAEIIVPG